MGATDCLCVSSKAKDLLVKSLLTKIRGLVGVITAAVLLGVYDHRIKQLKESIDSLKALINSDNEKKKAAARLKADIHAMSVCCSNVAMHTLLLRG